jgi:hypothetical protein
MMQVDRLRGKAVYFVRNCPKAVGEKTVEQDLLVSHPQAMHGLLK